MTPKAKFREIYVQFESSGIEMTPKPKFGGSYLQFASLGTGMTHRDKLEDRWPTKSLLIVVGGGQISKVIFIERAGELRIFDIKGYDSQVWACQLLISTHSKPKHQC